MSDYPYMEHRHDPPRSYGDCYRCSLAALMGMPAADVPHFYHDGDEVAARTRIADFVAEHHLYIAVFPFHLELPQLLTWMREANPCVPYLLTGHSARGNGHTVLCVENRLVHDPARKYLTYRQPVTPDLRPSSDGFFWVEILTPQEIQA